MNGSFKRVGWVVREGGQPEVGYIFHKNTDSSFVSSLGDRNEYNSQHTPVGQNNHWQQLGTTHIFVNATQ